MATYVTDTEFKRMVRVCLDQNMSSEALEALEDADTLSLEEIIDSKIEDAAYIVVSLAPFNKLADIAKPISVRPTITGQTRLGQTRYKGMLNAPTDFARLVSIKMASWPHAVFNTLPPEKQYYEQANSAFGVFGTKDRPVVFAVPSGTGTLTLELYRPASANDTMEECLYVAIPKMVEGRICLADKLVRGTAYYAAFMTAVAIGRDADAATNLYRTAESLISN